MWVPYRVPTYTYAAYFLFVVAPCAPIGHTSWASMGTPMGHPYGYPIGHPFLGSTSLNYCPFGAGMYACGVPIEAKVMGTLCRGTHAGTTYGAAYGDPHVDVKISWSQRITSWQYLFWELIIFMSLILDSHPKSYTFIE